MLFEFSDGPSVVTGSSGDSIISLVGGDAVDGCVDGIDSTSVGSSYKDGGSIGDSRSYFEDLPTVVEITIDPTDTHGDGGGASNLRFGRPSSSLGVETSLPFGSSDVPPIDPCPSGESRASFEARDAVVADTDGREGRTGMNGASIGNKSSCTSEHPTDCNSESDPLDSDSDGGGANNLRFGRPSSSLDVETSMLFGSNDRPSSDTGESLLADAFVAAAPEERMGMDDGPSTGTRSSCTAGDPLEIEAEIDSLDSDAGGNTD